MISVPFKGLFLTVLSIPMTLQQNPVVDGNCISGRIYFNQQRILNVPAESANNPVDPNKFDMTIDYGAGNVLVGFLELCALVIRLTPD
jgi:hypothetical protein